MSRGARRIENRAEVPLPSQICVHAAAYSRDGGTVTFHTTDEEGFKRLIVLIQRMFLEIALYTVEQYARQIPGRLYFDGYLLGVRSAQEAQLLKLMRTATIRFDLGVVRVACLDWYDTSSGPVSGPPPTEEDPTVKRLRDSLNEAISFVESDAYVALAKEMDEVSSRRFHGG